MAHPVRQPEWVAEGWVHLRPHWGQALLSDKKGRDGMPRFKVTSGTVPRVIYLVPLHGLLACCVFVRGGCPRILSGKICSGLRKPDTIPICVKNTQKVATWPCLTMGEKCHFHALVNLAMVCTQQRDALSCLAQQSHTTMSGTPTSARSNMTRGSSLIC